MSQQTKLAMFRAALAAQRAGETHVTQERIVAALLRVDAVAERFPHAVEQFGDSPAPSLEECRDLMPTVERRPLEPSVKHVFDGILERHGRLAIPPLELLAALMDADPALAARFRGQGFLA